MERKIKLKEGEVLNILVSRTRKTKSEIANDLEISDQHLANSFKSESLTQNVRTKAAALLGVEDWYFNGYYVPIRPDEDFDILAEDDVKYERSPKVSEMTADQVFRYLEQKDKRHYEERGRLLAIIENLTKTK